jgi:AcrR family transcriptional regulator
VPAARVSANRPSAARERILDTASALFYAHGVRGVGVDTVIAASGVAKATLYAHFPAKTDLVVAYLWRADGVWRGKLREAAEAAGDDPRDQLVGMFDALTSACGRDGFRGCPFINTAAESEPGSAAHDVTVAHKRAVRAWVRDLAARAGAADPGQLSWALTVLVDGALSVAALESGADAAATAKEAARLLVRAACPDEPGTRGRPPTAS